MAISHSSNPVPLETQTTQQCGSSEKPCPLLNKDEKKKELWITYSYHRRRDDPVEGTAPIEAATVVVEDAISNSEIARSKTDDNGIAHFTFPKEQGAVRYWFEDDPNPEEYYSDRIPQRNPYEAPKKNFTKDSFESIINNYGLLDTTKAVNKHVYKFDFPDEDDTLWEMLVKSLVIAGQIPDRGGVPVVYRSKESLQQGLDFAWEVIQGDFVENPSLAAIITGTLISMIPVVDQVCDIRDLMANLMRMIMLGEYDDPMAWLALVLTLVGLFPEFGSLIKGIFKAVLSFPPKTLKLAFPRLAENINYFLRTNASEMIKKIRTELPNIKDKSLDFLRKILIDLNKKVYEILEYIKKIGFESDDLVKIQKNIKEVIQRADAKFDEIFKELGEKLDEIIEGIQPKKQNGSFDNRNANNVKQKAKKPGRLSKAAVSEKVMRGCAKYLDKGEIIILRGNNPLISKVIGKPGYQAKPCYSHILGGDDIATSINNKLKSSKKNGLVGKRNNTFTDEEMKRLNEYGFEFKSHTPEGLPEDTVLVRKYELDADGNKVDLDPPVMYHGDQDLQGVYKTKEGPVKEGELKYEAKTSIEDPEDWKELNKHIGSDQIMHGANDNYWIKKKVEPGGKTQTDVDSVPSELRNQQTGTSMRSQKQQIKESEYKMGRAPDEDEIYLVIEKTEGGKVIRTEIEGTQALKDYYDMKGIPWPPYLVPPYPKKRYGKTNMPIKVTQAGNKNERSKSHGVSGQSH